MRASIPLALALFGLVAAVAAGAVGAAEVSPATRAVLELDHQFSALQRNTSGATDADSTLQQNTAYNYATATQLFWHSVSR
jgi:hypothetical protein